MSQSQIITILEDAIMAVLKCSAPMMLAALVIGVVISIFQAATQISEQTLAFVPKIVGVFLALLVAFGYIMTEMTELTTRLYTYAVQLFY